MLNQVYTLKEVRELGPSDNSKNKYRAIFEEQESWENSPEAPEASIYKKTNFAPEWLELVGGKFRKALQMPEGECPSCGKWQSHSLSCPELEML
jgi:hypothetical protein